jgi:hypothetical protein
MKYNKNSEFTTLLDYEIYLERLLRLSSTKEKPEDKNKKENKKGKE